MDAGWMVFITHCEDRTFQLLNLSSIFVPPSTHPTLVLQQPAPILDFTWYPTASPHDPPSFCFMASIRECPVKLLDASDGRLRASYKIIDHRERFIAPHCMTFSLDATRLYCGYEDAIEVFDVSRPGEGTRIFTTPSRKSKDGLKGIMSALAFSQNYGTNSDGFYAAGALNSSFTNLVVYSESQGRGDGVPLMFIGRGIQSGITQIRFNPMRPHIMYAAYRRRDTILAWDLRADINVPFARYTISRKPMTNQKMGFDVDMSGQRLVAGDQGGSISNFDLTSSSLAEDSEEVHPDLVFNAHKDSVGSVAFHPYNPTLLSVSGSRHYEDLNSKSSLDGSDDNSDSDTSTSNDGDRVVPIRFRERLHPSTRFINKVVGFSIK